MTSYGQNEAALDRGFARALPQDGGGEGEEASSEVPPDSNSEFDWAGSRWSFFLSGTLSEGDRDETTLESGFDFDTGGLTAGVDYALGERWALGVALGYLDTETDYRGNAGSLDVEGLSLSGFATYYLESFYVDLLASFGRNDYRLARTIDLPVPFMGQSRLSAVGEPDGDQLGLGLALGGEKTFGATSASIFGRVSYVDSTIDRYAETTASPIGLEIDEQELESLLLEFGFEVTYAASYAWGVFQPQLRVSLLSEQEDDSRLIRARFLADRSFTNFVVATEDPDREYVNAATGFTATFARGRSFYLFFEKDLSRGDLTNQTLSTGLRLEF